MLTTWSDPFIPSWNRYRDDWQISDPFRELSYNPSSLSRANLRNGVMAPLSPLLSVDLIEAENEYRIHADLPGVEGLDLEMKDDHLIIKAERKAVHEKNTDIAHSIERSYGKVQRQIALPKNIDRNGCNATFKDGVLKITFPKLPAKPASATKKD